MKSVVCRNSRPTFAVLLVALIIIGFAILLVPGAFPVAHAGTTTTIDATGCPAIGGTWDASTSTCTLAVDYTVNSGDSLSIPSGTTLSSFLATCGTGIHNFGTITNDGTMQNACIIHNQSGGRIDSDGTITNNGEIANDAGAYIGSSGTFDNSGGVDNSGTIENRAGGTIANEAGGRLNNSGTISNFDYGDTINNSGTINNLSGGRIDGDPGGTINNPGTFNNHGTVCGGIFNNSGVMNGNAFATSCTTSSSSSSVSSSSSSSIPSSDWAVSSVGLNPLNPHPGDSVTFTMTMNLLSTSGSIPQMVSVQCQLDDQSCGGGTVAYPGPVGQPFTVQSNTPWVATAGTHTLVWSIDSTNDPNPANNVMSTSFTVQPAPVQNVSSTSSIPATSASQSSNPSSTVIQTQTVTQQPTSQQTVPPPVGACDLFCVFQQNSLLLSAAVGVLVVAAIMALKRRGGPASSQPATGPTRTETERIFCGQCGTSNPSNNRFCGKCGQKLAAG